VMMLSGTYWPSRGRTAATWPEACQTCHSRSSLAFFFFRAPPPAAAPAAEVTGAVAGAMGGGGRSFPHRHFQGRREGERGRRSGREPCPSSVWEVLEPDKLQGQPAEAEGDDQ
jgi:hypothetical protein